MNKQYVSSGRLTCMLAISQSSRNEPCETLTIKSNTIRAISSLASKMCVETSTLKKSKNTREKMRHVVNLEVSCTVSFHESYCVVIKDLGCSNYNYRIGKPAMEEIGATDLEY